MNPDGDMRAGILSQTYWTVLEHRNHGQGNQYRADMTLDNCETYVAEITGICPVAINKTLKKAEISGTLQCGKIQHKYKAGLRKNKYVGHLFASGLTPWVTGTADWTNAGVTIYKGENNKLLPRFHEQEYIINYEDNTFGVDAAYGAQVPSNSEIPSTTLKENRQVLTSSIPAMGKSNHNELSAAVAWALDMNVYKQNWAKVANNPRTWVEEKDEKLCLKWSDGDQCTFKDDDGTEHVKYNLTADECYLAAHAAQPSASMVDYVHTPGPKKNCIMFNEKWAPTNTVKPQQKGDNFFMGGWNLVNPAWKTGVATNMVDVNLDSMLGVTLVVFDPSYAGGFDAKKDGRGGRSKKSAHKAAPASVKAGYVVKVGGRKYTSRSGLKAVFYDRESFDTYIHGVAALRNVEVLDYGSLSQGSKNAYISGATIKKRGYKDFAGLEEKQYITVAYALIKGSLAACEHCLPSEIEDTIEDAAAGVGQGVIYLVSSSYWGKK